MSESLPPLYYKLLLLLADPLPLPTSRRVTEAIAEVKNTIELMESIVTLQASIDKERSRQLADAGVGKHRPEAWSLEAFAHRTMALRGRARTFEALRDRNAPLADAVEAHCRRKAAHAKETALALDAAAQEVDRIRADLKRKQDDVGQMQTDLDAAERRCKEARLRVTASRN